MLSSLPLVLALVAPPANAGECPCDPLDWRCLGENESLCPTEAEPEPQPQPQPQPQPAAEAPRPQPDAAREAERSQAQAVQENRDWYDRAQARQREERAVAAMAFDRQGTMLGISSGFAHCPQSSCDAIKIGGLGQLEIGYRHNYVAFSLVGSYGGGKVKESQDGVDVDGSLTFGSFGPQFTLFPVKSGRVDPYLGILFGYLGTKLKTTTSIDGIGDPVEYEEKLQRGTARVSLGLNVYVNAHVGLGPRFDLWFPFLGKACIVDPDADSGEGEDCEQVQELIDSLDNSLAERSFRRSLPKPRSVTFNLFAVF